MATKRSHSGSEDVHPSRQDLVHDGQSIRKKPRRHEGTAMNKQAHVSSVSAIKKRIRDVTRRLERVQDLPADVRAEDERALAAYQKDLETATNEKFRQKMIKKYRMVRFFERQKATRRLKKLKKRLITAESIEEAEALKVKIHEADVDINYTQYFPLSERYVSLYPRDDSKEKGDDEEDDDSTIAKPPMWKEVEERMTNGSLDQLRNRVVTRVIVKQPSKAKAKPIMPTEIVKQQSRPVDHAGQAQPPKAQTTSGKGNPGQLVQASVPTQGLNRRERRRLARAAAEKLGVQRPAHSGSVPKNKDDNDNLSDGGFFEE